MKPRRLSVARLTFPLAAALAALLSPPVANATTLYWDVNNTAAGFSTVVGTWGTNVWNDTASGTGGTTTAVTTNLDDLNIVAATTNTGTITVSGAQVANSITYGSTVGAVTISGGTSITLGNGTANAGGITLSGGSANQLISTALILNNSQTWTNNSTGTLTFGAGGLSLGANTLTFSGTGNFSAGAGTFGNAGSGGIIMNGSGVLNLRVATNTNYTGSTTINSGVVLLNAGTKSTGNFNLNGGMVTDYFQQTGVFSGGLGTGANQIQIHGDSGFGAGNGTSTWRIGTAGSVLTWGSTHFDPTTLKFMTAADNLGPTIYGIVNFDNGLNLGGAARTIDVLNASANPTNSGATIAGVISNGSLIKTGGGNLNLGNAGNTYAGTTTISGGFLTVASSGALGSASNTLEFNGGTLRASGTVTSLSTRAVTMTATGIIDTNGQAISIAGNIGGAGGLTKNSTGTLTLSGTNSYGGVTTLNAGTLVITKEAALASNTAANLNIKGGAILQLNVDSAGAAGFSSANLSTLLGNISVANTAAQGLQAGATLSIDTSTATGATFTQGNAITNSTGAFGGFINLIKLGAGTLVLDKANTYTGGTTITAGTLQLNDGGSVSARPIFLNGGTFASNRTGTTTLGTNTPATIIGAGGLANVGSGTLVINAPTYHTGNTAATAGNITLSHQRALQYSALDTTGAGSVTLSGTGSATPVLGGLANSGTTRNLASVIDSSYGSVTNLTLNPQSGSSFTYSGVIADGAAGMHLTKTGAGTQTLTGTSTYTGTTFLNNGTLTLGSGTGKITGTTDLNFNGGTLQFNRATNADINAINNAATITVNSSSTFGVTSADAGGASANETIGAVTLNAGQMNFNWTNGASSGAQMILTSLSRSGTASANFNGTLGSTGRWRVTGAGSTTAGQIIGPWYTTGAANAGFASTDYAVFGSDFIAAANIAGSAETTWTNAANAYTTSAGGTVTLTGTRTITALRNTGATTVLTLASTFNLETYGLLNGAATLFTVAPGTGGVLTTPTGGGNLYINAGAGAITVSAPINNNGGNVTLVKNGSGTLTLTSTTSNFSGGVVLNAGTLAFDSALNIGGSNNTGGSTVPITVNGSATMTTVSNTAVANLGTGAIAINTGGTLTLTGASRGTFTIGGAITGDGGLTLGYGSFWGRAALNSTSNTFKGALTITGGNDDGNSLFTINSIADGAGHGNIILNVSSSEGDVIGLDYGTGGANGAGGGGATSALVLNHRQIVVQGTSTNTFNNASNQNVTINTDIGFIGTGARSMRFGVNARAGSGVNTFAGKLTDNVGGAFSAFFAGGTWIASNNNNYTGTTGVSAGNVTFSGDNTTTGLITVSGTAGTTLTLSGDNSGMSGGVSLSTATATVGSSPRLNINSNTALGTGVLTFGGGAATDVVRIDNTSAGTVNVSTANAITMNRNFTFVGTRSLNLGTGTTTLGGLTAGTNRIITVSANTLTLGGTVAEAAANLGITKQGTGTLQLSGANTYNGSTTISAGVVRITNGSGLGSTTGGTSVASNTALEIDGSGGAVVVGAETISINGGGISNAGAIRNISGNNTYGGAVTMAAQSRINSDSGTLLLNNAAAVTSTNFTLVAGGAGNVSISGAVALGTGGILKDGLGVLTLSGTNTYTGVTTITNGTLSVGTIGDGGVAGNLGQATAVATNIVFNGGTLRYTGANATSNRAFTINAGTVATIETANDISFAGATGTATNGGLTKTGNGKLTITGINTYTGATTVSDGTLAVNGSLNSTAVTVQNGGTLQGSGSIAGSVTVEAGGTHAAGNSIQSLAEGTLTLNASSTFAYEVDRSVAANVAGDLTAVTGNLNLAATNDAILTITDLGGSGTWDVGEELTLISYSGTWNGGLFTYLGNVLNDDSVFLFSGAYWEFDYNDLTEGTNFTADLTTPNFVTMTVVPETSTALLSGLGALALLRRRRK